MKRSSTLAQQPMRRSTLQIITDDNKQLQLQISERQKELNELKTITNLQKRQITEQSDADQRQISLQNKQLNDAIPLDLPVSFASHSQYLAESITRNLSRSQAQDDTAQAEILSMHELRYRVQIENQQQKLHEIRSKKVDKESLIRDLVNESVFAEF